MRILIALAVLQTALLAFLVLQSLRTGDPAPPDPVPARSVPPASAPSALPADEGRLRRILREELAGADRDSVPPSAGVTHPRAGPPPRPRDAEADQARLEEVMKKIAYHRSLGVISETDMDALQADIARLDPDSRLEMLNALTRALNSGEIRGHLR